MADFGQMLDPTLDAPGPTDPTQPPQTVGAISPMAASIARAAQRIGISPLDFATTISYETGGTFDPWKAGPTTKWGQHRGLIQWGQPQARQYGVYEGMPDEEQVDKAAQYLVDRGVKPGMGLLDIYAAINAGGVGPDYYGRSDTAAGGAPGTVADKVRNQMGGHRAKAEAFLAGNWAPGQRAPAATRSGMAQTAAPGTVMVPVDHDPFAGQPPAAPRQDSVPYGIVNRALMSTPAAAVIGAYGIENLLGLGGRERQQTWLEKTLRSGSTAAGDAVSGSLHGYPGLRREDYTDDPGPTGPTTDSTRLGRWLGSSPVRAQPADMMVERAMDMQNLAMLGGSASPMPKGASQRGYTMGDWMSGRVTPEQFLKRADQHAPRGPGAQFQDQVLREHAGYTPEQVRGMTPAQREAAYREFAQSSQFGNEMAKPAPEAPLAITGPADATLFANKRPLVVTSGGKRVAAEAASAPESAAIQTVRRSLEQLEVAIPPEVRRAGSYTPGVGTKPVDGGNWSDKDLTAPGGGAPFAQRDLDSAFVDSLEKVASASPDMRERVEAFVREHPTFSPNTHEFWDKAMRLPARARLWYEVSAETFDKGLRGRVEAAGGKAAAAAEYKQLFDTIAATSAQADPTQNERRTIGVLAEHLQNLPIHTDITDKTSVRKALSTGLTGLKTGSFSGTFSHILGLDDTPPLSVNDRQVASMFGITQDDLMSNPWLYEVMSRFFIRIRDEVNTRVPEIAAGKADPYETWQLQALGWVQHRGDKNAAKGAVEQYDDYALVGQKLEKELAAAGVDTSGGIFSDGVLLDPRTPDIMSGTRRYYTDARHATLETATTLTKAGSEAHKLGQALSTIEDQTGWRGKAASDLERIQRRAMDALATRVKGSASPIEDMFSAVLGRKVGVTRIDSTGYGTFDGATSPNMRIPMIGRVSGGGFVDLSAPENTPARRALLAAFGQKLNQAASAASQFKTVPHDDPSGSTYSVFIKSPEKIDPKTVAAFEKEIGYPLNVSQPANGTVIDINVGGFDTLPELTNVQRVADVLFPGQDVTIFRRAYESDYLDASEYKSAINEFWKGKKDGRKAGDAGGVAGARSGRPDFGLWTDSLAKAEAIAKARDADYKKWSDTYRDKILAEAKPVGKPGVAVEPVDHDPFADTGGGAGAQTRKAAGPTLFSNKRPLVLTQGQRKLGNFSATPEGKLVGYRVVDLTDDGQIVSQADRRTVTPASGDYGVPSFVSNDPKYVIDHYGHGGWGEEGSSRQALVKMEFDPKDILSGNPGDRQPELSVRNGKIVSVDEIRSEADAARLASSGASPVVTDSPRFKRWFGKSKVVDGGGAPLPVYHGTAATRIAGGALKPGNGWYGRGIYFTDSPAWASEFAEETARDGVTGANVMPVYLSLQRPYVFREKLNDTASNVQLMRELGMEDAEIDKALRSGREASAITNALKHGGHDGLVVLSAEGRNEYVAFSPEQVKSATGNSGDFDPHNPSILFSNRRAPVFYSGTERAVMDAPIKSASGAQWLGTLKNKPGVKTEELEWMGLPDWLSKQEGPVTKDQVLDYVAQNKVELKEKVLTDDAQSWRVNTHSRFMHQPEFKRIAEQARDADEARIHLANDYEAYQAAMRIPELKQAADRGEVWANVVANDMVVPTHTKARFGERVSNRLNMDGEFDNYREIIMTIPPESMSKGTVFREERHWPGTPNVLAWSRANDRVIDGKRSLFLEEIQSDWHQQGRDHGYKTADNEQARADAEREVSDARKAAEFERQQIWLRATGGKAANKRDALDLITTGDITAEHFNETNNRLNDAETQYTGPYGEALRRFGDAEVALTKVRRVDGGVPDAPLKKTWHEMMLKRMIREAAEKGYDQLAWTPGEVQNDRYSLATHVNRISWARRSDGTYDLSIDPRGEDTIIRDDQTPDQVAELLGKEMAQRIIDDKGEKVTSPQGYDARGVLEGDNLKIGGSGMKGFYDKMLVDAANKIGKAFGARVGAVPVTLPSPMEYRVVNRGTEAGPNWRARGGDGQFYGPSFRTRELAEDWVADEATEQKVWVLPITPELRDAAVGKGFALFMKGVPVVRIDHDPFEEEGQDGRQRAAAGR
jgi:hypothetical protein